jgi:NAD(P)-dependent dehydrogenase (short-subunit alcohol dehydrogenase family)
VQKKVVIVTGANQGIGFHLTQSLLAQGSYWVAGLDLSGDNLTTRDVHLGALRFYQCDVTDQAAVDVTVKSIIEAWGRIDILVNNACLAVFGRFEEKELEKTRHESEVNYFG